MAGVTTKLGNRIEPEVAVGLDVGAELMKGHDADEDEVATSLTRTEAGTLHETSSVPGATRDDTRMITRSVAGTTKLAARFEVFDLEPMALRSVEGGLPPVEIRLPLATQLGLEGAMEEPTTVDVAVGVHDGMMVDDVEMATITTSFQATTRGVVAGRAMTTLRIMMGQAERDATDSTDMGGGTLEGGLTTTTKLKIMLAPVTIFPRGPLVAERLGEGVGRPTT